MRNFPQQAKQALRVYLERGEDAIAKAESGDVASFEDVLRWRKAAFHNFRVADDLALQNGQDISEDPDVLQVWASIKKTDDQLRTKLHDLREQTGSQIKQLSDTRQKLGRYRSGRPGTSKFTHSA